MQQLKMKNLLLGGVVVVLVLLLWFTQVYQKMEHQASKSKSAASATNEKITSLRAQLDSQTAKNKRNGSGPSDAALKAAIPATPAEAAFLRDVDVVRIESGVTWQSITPTAPSGTTSVGSVNVTINVTGNEDQIARYMAGLSAMKRIFVLDNVTIASGGSSAPAGGSGGVGGAAPGAAPPVVGVAGATFLGSSFQVTLAGRVFSAAAAPTATAGGVSRSTTPVTGAAAPTGGASSPGVQNG